MRFQTTFGRSASRSRILCPHARLLRMNEHSDAMPHSTISRWKKAFSLSTHTHTHIDIFPVQAPKKGSSFLSLTDYRFILIGFSLSLAPPQRHNFFLATIGQMFFDEWIRKLFFSCRQRRNRNCIRPRAIDGISGQDWPWKWTTGWVWGRRFEFHLPNGFGLLKSELVDHRNALGGNRFASAKDTLAQCFRHVSHVGANQLKNIATDNLLILMPITHTQTAPFQETIIFQMIFSHNLCTGH